jgi:hypothetical protein
MCDFKVGDEVVRFRDNGRPFHELNTTGTPPLVTLGGCRRLGVDMKAFGLS